MMPVRPAPRVMFASPIGVGADQWFSALGWDGFTHPGDAPVLLAQRR